MRDIECGNGRYARRGPTDLPTLAAYHISIGLMVMHAIRRSPVCTIYQINSTQTHRCVWRTSPQTADNQ